MATKRDGQHEEFYSPQVEETQDNVDRADRHNNNPANRPSRLVDPAYTNKPKDKSRVQNEFTDSELIFNQKVGNVLEKIAVTLQEKNKKYGNSALEPKRIFSKENAISQLEVRIDDKLSRISNQVVDGEDTLLDLLGYLVLLTIANEDA